MRLDIIKKYTLKCDNNYLEELTDANFNQQLDNKNIMNDYEQFIILVGYKIKELIYNEQIIKKNKNNNE